MKFIFYILSAILLFSCGDSPTEEELEQIADENDPSARIKMDMDDNLLLTLSVKNFSAPLSFLSFTLVYDYNIFGHSPPNAGIFTMNFSSDDFGVDDSEYMSFNFSGVSGSGDLLKIQFSGSSYNGTTIYLQDVEMFDSNSQKVENASDTYSAEQICYIDKHPTNGDDYGDYRWRNQFCFPIQTDWRDP